MSNKSINIALAIVVLGVFNILFFLWLTPGAAEWICYGAITLGVVWLGASVALPHAGSKETYSLTLPKTAGFYLLAAAAASAALIATHASATLTLTVQLVLLAISAVVFGINVTANRNTAAASEKHKKAVDEVKNTAFDIKMMMGDTDDSDIRKALGHLYDTISASPAKTTADRSSFNQRADEGVRALAAAIVNGNKNEALQRISALERLYTERNR